MPASRAAGLVLDVNGVGYLIQATPSRCSVGGGDELTVETYLVVREDALQLYGFASADERDLFVHLLSVSGVGPKVALAIVSGSPPAELRRAIALEDTARFEAIPGIGKKTAQRVVLELKEKLAAGVVAPAAGRDLPRETRSSSSATPFPTPSARSPRSITSLPPEEQIREALKRAA